NRRRPLGMIGHCSWDREQGVQILEDPPFAPSAKTKTALSAKDGAPSLSWGIGKPINRYTRKVGPPVRIGFHDFGLQCSMLTKPGLLLRVEGSLLFAVSIVCYYETHASWILFAVLLLAPDLFMLGYLANAKIGATIYNSVHTLIGPLLLIAYALLTAH